MRILVAGDLLPTEINETMFEAGDAERLFGEKLLTLFQESDFNVANLEGVLVDHASPIEKSGPLVKASTKSVKGILPLKLHAVSLANNHSLDFGMEGLRSTINTFNAEGIATVGAGENLSAARKPYIEAIGDKTIGIYACAETEFTIASDCRGGANPFDDLEICDDIVSLRENVDYLIVLYHGMKELYCYPAPYVQKRCRKLVDKGADLVLCQHSHCIGCMEEYGDAVILYGQGDFMFCREENEFRKNGLIVSIEFPERKVAFLPVVRNGGIIHLADEAEGKEILDGFYYRSEEIKQPGFLQERYDQFAATMLQKYDADSLGRFGGFLKKIHLSKRIPKMFRKSNDLDRLNDVQCEAHRDLFIDGLKNRLGL